MVDKDNIIKEAQQIINRYEKRYESEFGLFDRAKKKKRNKVKLALIKGIVISVLMIFAVAAALLIILVI